MSRGSQGLHLRRRSGRLVVVFHARVTEPAPPRPPLGIRSEGSRVVLQGTLSSGSLGWILSARASCYRRTITVEVTAARRPGTLRSGVEDQEYEAILEGVGAGRFLLRVNHVWRLNDDPGEMLVMPAFEGAIVI